MPLARVLAVLLLVSVAGCTGLSGSDTTTAGTTSTTDVTSSTPTTERQGTEPHTAVGTSHTDTHLVVHDHTESGNVTVTLGAGSDAATYDVEDGSLDLTREIHDRGHDVRVVVERGNETVFDQVVRKYQFWEVTVRDNDTSVTQTVV
ncbi:MAG: hypothetical protein ABEH83_00160 [Halobacterium sp.]